MGQNLGTGSTENSMFSNDSKTEGKSEAKLTPLMQQYWQIKSAHPDKVVLFRMGDFFEMFHRDAEVAAPILNIALTQRNKKSNDDTKMCGVPHHSVATPISKLLQAGYKVAICDQIEDAAVAKGLVKRAVTRVLTPGMVFDPETLKPTALHFIAAFDDRTVAFADVSTGKAFTYSYQSESELKEILLFYQPAEMVLHPEQKEVWEIFVQMQSWPLSFHATTKAIGRLQDYVEAMQGEAAKAFLQNFEEKSWKQRLELNSRTLKHLEIFESSIGSRENSLCEVIDRTRTSFGARMLREWLAAPSIDAKEIHSRQDQVEHWMKHPQELKRVREFLSSMNDFERRMARLASPQGNARDILVIAGNLSLSEQLSGAHGAPKVSEALNQLKNKIQKIIRDDAPLGIKEGGMIQNGVSPELDEYLDLAANGQKKLLELEAKEKERSGINSLKVRYNNVFGYYIEVTNTHLQKVPGDYLRKQTLANAERFTTKELQELEAKILSAESRRCVLEFEIFSQLKNEILSFLSEILWLSRELARFDVLTSFAWLALERGYVRPVFNKNVGSAQSDRSSKNSGTSKGIEILIEEGRHPVLEQSLKKTFVANTVKIQNGQCWLITGPNMAGKSTLMRQIALLCVMAQSGCFIPATKAELPILDQILTRIGANDSLSQGLSTFMVEMVEAAEILQKATDRSLVLLDEIGRGTSTYDGMSLAQSILEFLVHERKPYLFFATHYHELTKLSEKWPQIQNWHMSIRDDSSGIQFLYSLAKGPAEKSYGIHVAQLAKLPSSLIARAQQLLSEHEASASSLLTTSSKPAQQNEHLGTSAQAVSQAVVVDQPLAQMSFWDAANDEFIREIKNLDIAKTTPLEALQKVSQWQQKLS